MHALGAGAPAPEPELLGFALNRLMACWNARVTQRLAERGIGFPQWRVLMVAARAERPLAIVELSERTLVPHSTLSRQLSAMEKLGLVRRMHAAEDGRAVQVMLTARGRARYREALPIVLAETGVGLAALTPEEVAQLRGMVARIGVALGLAPR
jgi:DNA-binding MarR family transcriptional regulator